MKTEIWDKIQYIFRHYYDRMIHMCIEYDGKLDIKKMEKAICDIINQIDIFRCSCKQGVFRGPYWKINEPMTEKDALTLAEVSDMEYGVHTALSQFIELDAKYQIKFTVVRCAGKDSLCVILNHMVCDGTDAKYVIAKIIEAYNTPEGEPLPKVKNGTRSGKQLYDLMDKEFAKAAKKLNKNVSRGIVQRKFPFKDEGEKETTRIIRAKMDKDTFLKLKAKCKAEGITINDSYLAAFMKETISEMQLENGEINIMSMFNNRRYMKDGETLGVTNMTGFMPCKINYNGEKSFEEILQLVVEQSQKLKKDEFTGLYGVPLLFLAFRIFPYHIAETAIRIGYANPLIGMSNIGIMDEKSFKVNGLNIVDAFAAGACKKKPYVQIATTTFNNEASFVFPQICTDKDEKQLREFLERFINTLKDWANK